jgi:arylsulfatase A-like enzyme
MKPNIVYIYADDLGRGMLSCYGQKQFKTPNIDRLADGGVRCMRSYGTAFCAPARSCLFAGIHDAHSGRWSMTGAGIYHELTKGVMSLDDISEVITNTGIRPRDGDTYMATVPQRAGYVTAQIGKLGWGFATCGEDVEAHGWDYHYGYYDHEQCHGFYPCYVFENGEQVDIPGNTLLDFGKGKVVDGVVMHSDEGRAVYSQDLFDEKIIEFLRQHKDEPFFLFHPSQLPHGPTYYPEYEPGVAENPDLTPIEKEYASMVLRLDKTVGLILDELEALGLRENTLVLFASDNGHASGYYNQPGRCSSRHDQHGRAFNQRDYPYTSERGGDVFDGNDGLSGMKTNNWEGGGSIPFIANWPGQIPPGTVSDHLLNNYDTMATLADLLDVEIAPGQTDGVSFLAALKGESDAPEHDYIIYCCADGPCLVARDGWKLRMCLVDRDRAVQRKTPRGLFAEIGEDFDGQLYYLVDDPQETRNLAEKHPGRYEELLRILLKECDGNLYNGTPTAHFAFSMYETTCPWDGS